MVDEMIRCVVSFNEDKCKITILYECSSKNTTNVLYSHTSPRMPNAVELNFSYAANVLRTWKVHECEIKDLLADLRNPEVLNEIQCGITRSFTLN